MAGNVIHLLKYSSIDGGSQTACGLVFNRFLGYVFWTPLEKRAATTCENCKRTTYFRAQDFIKPT